MKKSEFVPFNYLPNKTRGAPQGVKGVAAPYHFQEKRKMKERKKKKGVGKQ